MQNQIQVPMIPMVQRAAQFKAEDGLNDCSFTMRKTLNGEQLNVVALKEVPSMPKLWEERSKGAPSVHGVQASMEVLGGWVRGQGCVPDRVMGAACLPFSCAPAVRNLVGIGT